MRLAKIAVPRYGRLMAHPKKQKKTEIVFVRLTPDMRKRLRMLAQTLDRSEAWVVADALAYYVPVVQRRPTEAA